MQSWIGKNKWGQLTAPRSYYVERLRYADQILERAQAEYRHHDIKILMVMYSPIIDKIKRGMERRYGRERRSDIEDVVYSEFMHMLQMYDGTRKRPLKFPNFLKSYYEGWCYRQLSQIMATTRKGPMFLNSSHFDHEQISHIELLSGASESSSDSPESEIFHRDTIKVGLDAVKLKHGERAVDALLLAHLYGYTHIEISEVLGCTQPRVSQMLQDAKECFLERVSGESEDA